MTVNELIQKLVELARDGKGQWAVCIKKVNIDDWESEFTLAWPTGLCEFDGENREVEFIAD